MYFLAHISNKHFGYQREGENFKSQRKLFPFHSRSLCVCDCVCVCVTVCDCVCVCAGVCGCV